MHKLLSSSATLANGSDATANDTAEMLATLASVDNAAPAPVDVPAPDASKRARKRARKLATVAATLPTIPEIIASHLAPEPAPVAEPVAAPVATPARPDKHAAFRERRAAALALSSMLYAGASRAVHSSDKIPSFAAYAERVICPVQRVGPSGPTVRDNAALFTAFAHANPATLAFDPAAYGADIGAISRGASIGRFTVATDGTIRLTNVALHNARAIARKLLDHPDTAAHERDAIAEFLATMPVPA